MYHANWLARTEPNKRKEAKFGEQMADALCSSCPKLVGGRKEGNSSKGQFFCTSLHYLLWMLAMNMQNEYQSFPVHKLTSYGQNRRAVYRSIAGDAPGSLRAEINWENNCLRCGGAGQSWGETAKSTDWKSQTSRAPGTTKSTWLLPKLDAIKCYC